MNTSNLSIGSLICLFDLRKICIWIWFLAEIDSIYGHRSCSSIFSQQCSTVEQSNISKTVQQPNEEVQMKRHLGLFSGVSFVVGMIIGMIVVFN